MKSLLLACLLVTSAAPALAAELILYPNETRYVASPTWVTCSAGPGGPVGTSLQLCDCKYSGSMYGQALGRTGSEVAAQCTSHYQYATPSNCQKLQLGFTDQVLCDCKYSGSNYGQAFGIKGEEIAAQCEEHYQYAVPMNCGRLPIGYDEQVFCDCKYSGSMYGVAFGTSGVDVAKQCTDYYRYAVPMNCRAQ